MKYAVIRTGGKQYKVTEGDVIDIDRLSVEKDGKIVFEDVLLVVKDGSVKIGKPDLSGEKGEGRVVDNIKGDKIRVSKFKSKVRYRNVTGFRAFLSQVKIEKIGDGVKADKEKTAKPKKKA